MTHSFLATLMSFGSHVLWPEKGLSGAVRREKHKPWVPFLFPPLIVSVTLRK